MSISNMVSDVIDLVLVARVLGGGGFPAPLVLEVGVD